MSDEKDDQKIDNNIKELPNKERDEKMAQLEKARRNMEFVTQNLEMLAQMRKAAFDAYIEAGFSEEQALKLVIEAK